MNAPRRCCPLKWKSTVSNMLAQTGVNILIASGNGVFAFGHTPQQVRDDMRGKALPRARESRWTCTEHPKTVHG